jgi:hypothetical protein
MATWVSKWGPTEHLIPDAREIDPREPVYIVLSSLRRPPHWCEIFLSETVITKHVSFWELGIVYELHESKCDIKWVLILYVIKWVLILYVIKWVLISGQWRIFSSQIWVVAPSIKTCIARGFFLNRNYKNLILILHTRLSLDSLLFFYEAPRLVLTLFFFPYFEFL